MRTATDDGMNVDADRAEDERANVPEAGWPGVLPYTVHFPEGDGYIGADLEHPAPLPRVGEVVEYIDERGECQRFRVREVIHTLQSAASQRPAVKERNASPHSLARVRDGEPAERPGETGIVRAGLPKVLLERL